MRKEQSLYKNIEKKLSHYTMYKISIENLKEKIAYLEGITETGISGINYDSIPTSETNRINSIVENEILAKSEKIYYFERQIKSMELDIESIDRAMTGLNDIERYIITEFYINSKQWWEVAAGVKYSEQHCKKVRKEAMEKLIMGMYGKEIKEEIRRI